MIALPEVRALLDQMVVAVLWTNRRDADHKEKDKANLKIKEGRFKLKFIPWYVVLDSDGNVLGKMDGQLAKAPFIAMLKDGLERVGKK